VYASHSTFKPHFKTNKHLIYQQSRTEHDLRIQLSLRDKEVAILSRRLSDCKSSLVALQNATVRKKIRKSREELKKEITVLIVRQRVYHSSATHSTQKKIFDEVFSATHSTQKKSSTKFFQRLTRLKKNLR
jgi:hypothetical protein